METAAMAKPVETPAKSPNHGLISKPLFKQSLKANKTLFLVVLLGMCALISIINIVIGKNTIFTKINMDAATVYMKDEDLDWLKVLGLFQVMGFGLNRLAVMASLDMSVILDSIIYGIAMIILPMLYVVSVSNSLIATQIDNGSMAYVLSTPTNRRQVVFTQALFLFGSLLAIYLGVFVVDLGTKYIGYGVTTNPLRTFLLEFGSYLALSALAGIAFMSSCLFNRTRKSLALGGGFAVWCFLAMVIGLFGTKTFVSLGLGVEAMRVFNYMTLLTLFDTESVDTFCKYLVGSADNPSYWWILEYGILILIASVTTVIGMRKFEKKDLPL
jgi:ABC-type transport system involved in multi-copper enzyme maturation permease subunit